MFKYRERMLAWVPRWSVLPRVHTQSVAEHSFFVALYTDQLCTILEWDEARKYRALAYAVRHDMEEVITGDIMGPIKRMLVDNDAALALRESIYSGLGEYYVGGMSPTQEVRDVVKAANCIDEFFWLSQEVSMGNRSVMVMQVAVLKRADKALKRIKLDYIAKTLLDEADSMMKGLDFPQKDNDLDG